MNTANSKELRALPRYQQAAGHQRRLRNLLLSGLLLSGLVLWLIWLNLIPLWQPLFVTLLAMFGVLLATLHNAWWLTGWRARALVFEYSVADVADLVGQTESLSEGNDLSLRQRCRQAWQSSRTRASIILLGATLRAETATLVLTLAAAAILFLLNSYWVLPSSEILASADPLIANISPKILLLTGLFTLAFVLLVIERFYAGNRDAELPEAPHIVYGLRATITLTLALALGVLASQEGRVWPQQLMLWLGLLPGVIAVEFLLRAALTLFAPPRQQELELLAESAFTSLWRWPLRPFQHLQDELKQRFGVDLRQSWAFAYIKRAFIPVLTVLLGLAWLLTGLAEIPLAGRGIYERLGKPVAVWQPGVHMGLPWPLGRVQLTENGVVHELAATLAEASKNEAGQNESNSKVPSQNLELTVLNDIEGPAPATANRLWDASHLAEKSQIIASEVSAQVGNQDKRQSFHIVNMDVRFMYRIGLTDPAALEARYNTVDVPGLIRSTANRILVAHFASSTLEQLLGERRTQLAATIGARLQTDLNRLNSGVEIMTTVVEAIHPPAAAANAYHGVQAAQITAQAIIARERGNAASQVNLSSTRAAMARDQANAAARETLASATAAQRRFSAEREAYQQGSRAFLLEQYFAQLTLGLADAHWVLVDHRLPATHTTLDLRDFSAGLFDRANSLQTNVPEPVAKGGGEVASPTVELPKTESLE